MCLGICVCLHLCHFSLFLFSSSSILTNNSNLDLHHNPDHHNHGTRQIKKIDSTISAKLLIASERILSIYEVYLNKILSSWKGQRKEGRQLDDDDDDNVIVLSNWNWRVLITKWCNDTVTSKAFPLIHRMWFKSHSKLKT